LRVPVELDHLIVRSRDKRASAAFLADMLGLPPPVALGPGGRFHAIRLANDLSLDYADAGENFEPQHYAFRVSAREFDAVIERIRDRRIPHWADPQQTQPDQVADRGGGSRAVYFSDPSNHWIEVLMR
jgi:catechol 2,3-dioxygenase-like lactoylglutathione lyase family enzyme